MSVTKAKQKTTARISRAQVDKFGERRAELAEAALQTLSELGYARTSLREIAQNTDFSLGVLHYYFADKVELIMHCVRQYKARCVTRYDEIVASAKTADELRNGFAAGMAETLREDAAMHRLWYDLRTQSMFEKSFTKDVTAIDDSLQRMIWRIVSEYAALVGSELRLSPRLTYAIFDGLFQQGLLRHLHGDKGAAGDVERDVRQALGDLVVDERGRESSKGTGRRRVAARLTG
jgi:AcrR family transcriptional regulator